MYYIQLVFLCRYMHVWLCIDEIQCCQLIVRVFTLFQHMGLHRIYKFVMTDTCWTSFQIHNVQCRASICIVGARKLKFDCLLNQRYQFRGCTSHGHCTASILLSDLDINRIRSNTTEHNSLRANCSKLVGSAVLQFFVCSDL